MTKTFLIGSGKGGVGKSTLSVNLAVALAKLGVKVGLLDADIYGPSIPIMLGLRNLKPHIQKDTSEANSFERVVPFFKFGIRTMSAGFLMHEAEPGLWRGPVLHTLLQKMVLNVEWGDLDVLLIDLPPGTGDVPLSLAKLIPDAKALIVTTPQEVAVLDAIKAINAFDLLEIPLVGVIENMAGFETPNKTYALFGKGGGRLIADRFGAPFLGSLPLIPEIQISCDEGCPIAFQPGVGKAGRHFDNLAQHFLRSLL